MMRAMFLCVALCAAACTRPGIPDQWLGKWMGPEGTYLEIAAADGAYTVTVANLDGPRSFPAAASATALSFERDGITERIQATDGHGTGMKWLAGKSTCLTIKPGEGFCRE